MQCPILAVQKVLGRGSYGVVALTIDAMGNVSATKFIDPLLQEGMLDSYAEIDIMSRLSHPNLMYRKSIITHLECPNIQELEGGLDPDGKRIPRIGIVMPLASNSLSGLLSVYKPDTRTRMPSREKLKIFTEIVKGVAALHEQGYLHLDIKSDNIMVSLDVKRRVFVSDFGISVYVGDTKTSTFVGLRPRITITYAPPEVLVNGHGGGPYSALSDSWSLGVLLMEMVSQEYTVPLNQAPDYNIGTVYPRALALTDKNTRDALILPHLGDFTIREKELVLSILDHLMHPNVDLDADQNNRRWMPSEILPLLTVARRSETIVAQLALPHVQNPEHMQAMTRVGTAMMQLLQNYGGLKSSLKKSVRPLFSTPLKVREFIEAEVLFSYLVYNLHSSVQGKTSILTLIFIFCIYVMRGIYTGGENIEKHRSLFFDLLDLMRNKLNNFEEDGPQYTTSFEDKIRNRTMTDVELMNLFVNIQADFLSKTKGNIMLRNTYTAISKLQDGDKILARNTYVHYLGNPFAVQVIADALSRQDSALLQSVGIAPITTTVRDRFGSPIDLDSPFGNF